MLRPTESEIITLRVRSLEATIARCTAEKALLKAVPASGEYRRLYEEALESRDAESAAQWQLSHALYAVDFPERAAKHKQPEAAYLSQAAIALFESKGEREREPQPGPGRPRKADPRRAGDDVARAGRPVHE